MKRVAVVLATATVVVSASGAATLPPSNFGVQLTGVYAADGGAVLTRVPAGTLFVLPLNVATYKGPGDDEDGPVKLTGARSATYELTLSAGLDVQPAAPVGLSGVSDVSTTCLRGCVADLGADGTRIRVDFYYLVRATAPGSYTARARLTSTNRPDLDPSNDEIAITIEVVAAQAARVTAGKPVVAPSAPTAGRAFSLSLPLTRAGSPVTPTSVRCTASLRGAALRGSAARLAGRARCTWRLPATARGAQLKARLTAVAGGRTFTAARSARVR